MSYAKYENWKRVRLQSLPELSVVILTHNDEAHILRVIDRIGSYMSSLRYTWELIVCDSRSEDKTVKRLEELRFANLALVKADSPGAALQQGMLQARGGLVLFENIHDSTPIEEAGRLLPQLIEKHFDIAIGARLDPPQKRPAPLKLGERLGAQARGWLFRLFFKNPVFDPDAGFRLYSGPVAQRLFAHLAPGGVSPNLETLYLAGKLKLKVAEVPVGWVKTTKKEFEPHKKVIQLLPEMFKIAWQDLLGKYKQL